MKKTTIAILTCLASATFGFAASNSFTGGQIFDENESYQPLFKGASPCARYGLNDTADFNQDGFGDFVAIHQSTMRLWLNDQNGGFELVFESYVGGGDYYSLNAEDFNNDGFPDILVTVQCTPLIYINQLQGQTACAADLTGDGSVEVNDLLFVVAEWGPCE